MDDDPPAHKVELDCDFQLQIASCLEIARADEVSREGFAIAPWQSDQALTFTRFSRGIRRVKGRSSQTTPQIRHTHAREHLPAE